MRRREFIAGVGAAVLPLAAHAQQGERVRHIAVLIGGNASDPFNQANVEALRKRLQQLGWSEGGNIRIEWRFGEANLARGRALAAELVGTNPDVLLSDNTPLVQEFQKLTRTTPIVFASLADPVASGVVASLARPGGNATGFMNPEPAISARWLELLKEIAPNLSRVLVLVNAGNVGNQARLRVIQASIAWRAGVISDDTNRSRHQGCHKRGGHGPHRVAGPSDYHLRKVIVEQAARYRLPAIYPFRYFVTVGGLMSYGAEASPMWAQAATYVDRILHGEKPGDLPVQAPTRFELVINLKTAKTLGFTIPERLLATADEVIQ
jgi:putative tryptophan/tyrosine transport system substrate-binding protein